MESGVEMEKNEEEKIVIVGGGICGLATALALHRFISLSSISSLVASVASILNFKYIKKYIF